MRDEIYGMSIVGLAAGIYGFVALLAVASVGSSAGAGSASRLLRAEETIAVELAEREEVAVAAVR